MKYRKSILIYLIIIISFVIWWHLVNEFYIEQERLTGKDLKDMLSMYIGYKYFMQFGSTYLIFYLFFLNSMTDIFSVSQLARIDREKIVLKNVVKVVISALLFSAAFITVDCVCLSGYFSWSDLVDIGIISYMAVIMTELTVIYVFVGMLYMAVYTLLNHGMAAMVVVFAVNAPLCYYTGSEEGMLYGSCEMTEQFLEKGMNIVQWGIKQLQGICLIVLIYLIFREIYRRKDILCRK